MTVDSHQRVARRPDDFPQRRKHLEQLSDQELEQRFWKLTDSIVRPLVELASEHTSPAIERSVLLRMGFSSIEAKSLVDGIAKKGLLGKGAGHVVVRLARAHQLSIRDAGLALVEGKLWDQVPDLFREGGPVSEA